MPSWLLVSPRQMLPPPMTIQTCTPLAWISAISAAMPRVYLLSIASSSPARTSPLSFRTTRLYTGAGDAVAADPVAAAGDFAAAEFLAADLVELGMCGVGCGSGATGEGDGI